MESTVPMMRDSSVAKTRLGEGQGRGRSRVRGKRGRGRRVAEIQWVKGRKMRLHSVDCYCHLTTTTVDDE